VKLPTMTVGVLHPGEMGAALGAVLREKGESVLWASSGRSSATAERAADGRLDDVGTVEEVARRSDVVLAVCPPAAAVDVARSVRSFGGVYVDANAVSPATARTIAGLVGRYVDGGIVGPPPLERGVTRLYLSGGEAPRVADLFAGTAVDARVVSADIAAASAVKMTYAGWTKGTAALLLAIRAVARAEGIEQTLLDEWEMSLPELPRQSTSAARSAVTKGWRWVGEMEEIADTFAAAGLPDGFHRAAAEIYRRSPHAPDAEPSLEGVLAWIEAADTSAVSGEVEGKGERGVGADEEGAGRA
jgi:3-hydroxyisobutyrate dehydrogenase-like beta-hydroxyacid dehydrogenase